MNSGSVEESTMSVEVRPFPLLKLTTRETCINDALTEQRHDFSPAILCLYANNACKSDSLTLKRLLSMWPLQEAGLLEYTPCSCCSLVAISAAAAAASATGAVVLLYVVL
jgi:hypothetical protein